MNNDEIHHLLLNDRPIPQQSVCMQGMLYHYILFLTLPHKLINIDKIPKCSHSRKSFVQTTDMLVLWTVRRSHGEGDLVSLYTPTVVSVSAQPTNKKGDELLLTYASR